MKTKYMKLPILLALALPLQAMSAAKTTPYIYNIEVNDTINRSAEVNAEVDDIEEATQFVADDFPTKYQDKNQNRRQDGSETATVARLKRGDYFLVQDSLFKYKPISKHFPQKHFLDRAMLDLGGGIAWGTARADGARRNYKMGTGAHLRVGLSDWITPEHGWRASLALEQLPLKSHDSFTNILSNKRESLDATAYTLGLDYLLNFSAVGNRTYYEPKKFEFYGVAGLDVGYFTNQNLKESKKEGDLIFGGHLGLRGIYNFSSNNYLYLEPRLSIYHPGDVLKSSSSDGYAYSLGVTAGLGFRKIPEWGLQHHTDTLSSRGNDWFLQMSGGLGMPFEKFGGNLGPRLNLGIGKWLNRTSGLRFSANAGAYKNGNLPRMATIGAGLDYMWNLTRAFQRNATYNRRAEGPFYINYLLGFTYNWSDILDNKRHGSLGIGTGFQFNYHFMPMTDFYFEPRVDVYQKNYLTDFPISDPNKGDVVLSLLAGFTFHQDMHTKWLRDSRNPSFYHKKWYDHLFLQVEGGMQVPCEERSIRADGEFYLITARTLLGVGEWFKPTHGLRIFAEGGPLRQDATKPTTYYAGMGVEYLWNITNALAGYREHRPFEFVAGLGFINGYITRKVHKFNPGFSLSMQAHYYILPQFSLFVEPQLRIFGKKFMPWTGTNLDALTAVSVGAQLRAFGYDYADYREDFGQEHHPFMSLAAGYTHNLNFGQYGFSGRFSVGRWFTPVSALRGNITMTGFKVDPVERSRRQVKTTLGADYLLDFTNMAFGYKDRLFYLRPLVGLKMGVGAYSQTGAEFDAEMHIGVQGAFKITKKDELYVEPQLAYLFETDVYSRRQIINPMLYVGWNHNVNTIEEGLTHFKNTLSERYQKISSNVREIREHNEQTTPWTDDGKAYNKWFFELAAGPQILWSEMARHNMKDFQGYGGYFAFGRWFNSVNGIRMNLNGARLFSPDETNPNYHRETMGFGAEYAVSLSNAIWGYNPDRRFDFNAFVGPHLQWYHHIWKPRFAVDVALQPTLNFNRNYSLFIQPEMKIYTKGAIYPSSMGKNIQTGIMVGMQVHPENFDYATSKKIFDESDKRCFISASAGVEIPLRNFYSLTDEWGGVGRISFGKWFHPVSAWRVNVEGRAYRHGNINHTRNTQALLGADYILDITSMCYGYSDTRLFSLRALAGFNLGAQYMEAYDTKLHFLADIHTGGQFVFRISPSVELYAEPLMRWNWEGQRKGSRLSDVFPQLMAGINYRLGTHEERELTDDEKDYIKDSFVTLAVGTGCNTYTLLHVNKPEKLTFDMGATYGRWLNYLSGFRVGVSNSNFDLFDKAGQREIRHNNLTIQADYIMNLLSLFTHDETRYLRGELMGFLGVNYNLGFARHKDVENGFGVEAGFQLGYKLNKTFSIFMEPAVSVHTTKLYNSPQGVDGMGRVLFGVKYAF